MTDDTARAALKPCWNCRSADVYVRPADGERPDEIICNGCEMVLSGSGWTEERLIAAWNARAGDAQDAARFRWLLAQTIAKRAVELRDWKADLSFDCRFGTDDEVRALIDSERGEGRGGR